MYTKIDNSPKRDSHRGLQQLRVGVEIQGTTLRLTSIWSVDQPAVQAQRLIDPIVARVDLNGEPILVEAFADPRIIRGKYRPELGHSYRSEKTGLIHVSVPFTDFAELANVQIRLLDTTNVEIKEIDPASVATLFDRQPTAVLGKIDSADLVKHPDWFKLIADFGLGSGGFEIIAVGEETRWLLRGPAGKIITESRNYDSRELCEADIRWLQKQAALLPVVKNK